MIAKGLDLPAMETVGVILADSSLYLPDFTATERTYALLTQVSGRAGRGEHAGVTIIQTYSPNHPAIAAVTQQDYWAFVEAELGERQLLGYPPYRYLLKLTYSHSSDAAAATEAKRLAAELRRPSVEIVGPAPSFRQFASGLSHWQIIVKAKRRADLLTLATTIPTGWTSDIDPVNLL